MSHCGLPRTPRGLPPAKHEGRNMNTMEVGPLLSLSVSPLQKAKGKERPQRKEREREREVFPSRKWGTRMPCVTRPTFILYHPAPFFSCSSKFHVSCGVTSYETLHYVLLHPRGLTFFFYPSASLAKWRFMHLNFITVSPSKLAV